MNKTMTYVPSRLTSAETNKVIAGANEILDDDINLKQNVINTLNKRVIDIDSAPTSSTLTYTVNGVTCNFKVGDEVRVADQESETGYTFYKLYALTTESNVTTATWDKLGAGGGASKELVVVNCMANMYQTIISATVTINGVSYIVPTNGVVAAYVPTGTSYSIVGSDMNGFTTPASQSFTAGSGIRNVNLQWKWNGVGIFIEDTNGVLYTSSDWNTNKTANAIVCISGSHSFRMALSRTEKTILNARYEEGTDFSGPTDVTAAKADFNYEHNNDMLRSAEKNKDCYNSAYTIYYCDNFVFPLNNGVSYLPTMGQLMLLYQNKSVVDACLSVCGGDAISTMLCSSTLHPGELNRSYPGIWHLNWNNGSVSHGYNTLDVNFEVRPISNYE